MSDNSKKRILVVDDEKYITQLLTELLEVDYDVETAQDGIQAFNKIKGASFDLMLTDVSMPNLDGIELLRLSRVHQPNIVVVMMSGLATTDNVIDALNLGACHFIRKPFKIDDVQNIISQKIGGGVKADKAQSDIETIITDINYLILSNNYGKMTDIKQVLPSCSEAFYNILADQKVIKNLFRIKQFDDKIYRHSLDVGIIASVICSFKKVKKTTLQMITLSGFLHDIGKVNIDHDLLNKPGKLTPDEFDQIKMHTFHGHNILLEESFQQEVAEVAFKHHEKLDGSGYPRGYTEYGIDAASQFIAVCDIFSALTEERPYRGKLSPGEALEIIHKDFPNKINFEIVKLLQLFIEG